MFGCPPRVGLFTTPILRDLFDVVEGENSLTVLTACSERKDDAVFAKEASLNETVEVSFQRYKDTLPNNTVKLRAVCLRNYRHLMLLQMREADPCFMIKSLLHGR
ncbi:hypothetical protein TNIN_370521 [Trichonephila inaurata madagascariensis]|uniref:Uncharacterized protein n=1 Tax=Trichonephila inaurata madagascariensis TaxID=2747483 RepID=A0A8X7CC62_9ARAC|nr:hypothetical protein TNIN_370521 [Trichonephila inaurata madagascariensis]